MTDLVARALLAPQGEAMDDLQPLAERAGHVPAFDAAGRLVAAFGIDEVANAVVHAAAALAQQGKASDVLHAAALPGAAPRSVQQRLGDTISLADFPVDPRGERDCTTGFQAALDAAAGRTLFVPAGRYRVATLRVPADTALVGEGAPFNGDAAVSTRIMGTLGTDVLVLAPQPGEAFRNGGALRGLWIEGGRDGIVLGHAGNGRGTGGVTNVVIEDCCVRGQSGVSIRIPSWIERCVFRHLELYGRLGFQLDANADNGPEGNYMDKCLFEHVRLTAASNGMRCEPIRQSSGNTLVGLIFNGCGEDAAVFGSTCVGWTCIGWAFETNGHTALPKARAIGRIAAQSSRLDVTAHAFGVGQELCIAGAGRSGSDHIARVARVIGVSAVELATPALTAVSAAEVVNTRFCEIRGGTAFTFIGMGAGFDGAGDGIRYAVADALAPVFVNCQVTQRPVYDPRFEATVLSGDVALRRLVPPNMVGAAFRTTVTASSLPGTYRGSPAVQPGAPGAGVVVALRGAGDDEERRPPFGQFTVLRTDADRSPLLTVDADGRQVGFGGRGVMMSIGLNAAVPDGAGGVFALGDTSAPAAGLKEGGILFVENGALKFLGGNGTISTIAPA